MLKANKGDLVRILEGADLGETGLSVGDIVEISSVVGLVEDGEEYRMYFVENQSFSNGADVFLEAHEFELFRKAGEEDAEVDREQQIRKAAEQLGDLLARKNADYGNSFSEQYGEYGLLSALIRLDDKMRRLKTLSSIGEAQVTDEAIADTLLDMAGYALLAYVEEAI